MDINQHTIKKALIDGFFSDATVHDEPTTETTIVKLAQEQDVLEFANELTAWMWYNDIVENISIELDHDNLEIRITSK